MRVGLCAAAAGLLLSGCAVAGATGNEVLSDQVSTQARLVIYRTSPMGFAVQPPYSIDGKAIALSTPNGFIVCHLSPGPHQVAVGNFPINISFGGGSDKSGVTLRPGQTTYLKAEPQMGLTVGVITLTEVTENQGKADTASLHKLDGSCT